MRLSAAVLLCVATSSLVRGQDLVGNWQGKITGNGAEMRLVVHITKAADGTLSGTLDSIDQGAKGLPLQVQQDGPKVHLEMATPQATYDGTLSANGKTLRGTWTQGGPVALNFDKTDHPWSTDVTPSTPSDIDGRFDGKMQFGSHILRVVFRFTNTIHGLSATFQSPDQAPNQIPATAVVRNGSAIAVQMKQLAANFTGTISADHNSIAGTLTQGGTSVPLTVVRTQE